MRLPDRETMDVVTGIPSLFFLVFKKDLNHFIVFVRLRNPQRTKPLIVLPA